MYNENFDVEKVFGKTVAAITHSTSEMLIEFTDGTCILIQAAYDHNSGVEYFEFSLNINAKDWRK